jgi:hypothetical protein
MRDFGYILLSIIFLLFLAKEQIKYHLFTNMLQLPSAVDVTNPSLSSVLNEERSSLRLDQSDVHVPKIEGTYHVFQSC